MHRLPSKNQTNRSKMVVMVCFLIIDLGLNSSLDFDVFNEGLRRNFLLGLVGLQVVIQISIFLILFLAAADTFLFRVGLLNILVRTVGWLILLHPIYIVLTIVEGLERVRQLSLSDPLNIMNHLWSNQNFVTLSYIQKLVAIPYYIYNIRMTLTLEDPIYFNKDAWISLIKQQKRLYAKADPVL